MKCFVTILLLCLVQTLQAQFLNFDQLVNLQTRDLEYVNEFLVARGWQFDSSTMETDDDMGTAIWAHGKNEYDTEKAVAWFKFFYSPGYPTSIRYQIHSKTHYSSIKSRIAALGMKLVNSQILDDGLYSVYIGKNYAVKIISSGSTDSAVPKYIFSISTKESYLNSLD